MCKIIRFYSNPSIPNRTVQTGLTLEQAQHHCSDPNSSYKTCTTKTGRARTKANGPWFDGYTKQ